jgi:hypothetical protein
MQLRKCHAIDSCTFSVHSVPVAATPAQLACKPPSQTQAAISSASATLSSKLQQQHGNPHETILDQSRVKQIEGDKFPLSLSRLPCYHFAKFFTT